MIAYILVKGDRMNKNLIEINDNCSLITDEHGNISVVYKNGNKHSFEDILLLENKVENIEKKIGKCYRELENNKIDTIGCFIINLILFVGMIAIYMILKTTIPFDFLIALIAMIYVPLKIFIMVTSGTLIGAYFKKRKNKAIVEELEYQLSIIRKKIFEIKKTSDYKITKIKENNLVNDYNLTKANDYIDKNVNDEIKKVKVLTLKRR